MKSIVLDADSQFLVKDVEDPTAGPGEVLIRSAYAGIQWGDVMVKEGHMPTPRPFAPGFEVSGRVIAVGEGVDTGRVGESVVALTMAGAFAELTVASATLAIEASDLSLRTAGAFGWVTPAAYDLINTVGRVRSGEAVLIHAAAGGVGTLAVQFAKLAGAGRIVGVVNNEEQKKYAMQFGYDEILLSHEFLNDVIDTTFDVILDPIGTATREKNVELLAPHGRLVIYGNLAGFEPVSISSNDLLMQGKSALSYNSVLLSQTHPARLGASAREAMRLLVDGQVRIDVTAEFSLDKAAEGVERLSKGGSFGKSVVAIQSIV